MLGTSPSGFCGIKPTLKRFVLASDRDVGLPPFTSLVFPHLCCVLRGDTRGTINRGRVKRSPGKEIGWCRGSEWVPREGWSLKEALFAPPGLEQLSDGGAPS